MDVRIGFSRQTIVRPRVGGGSGQVLTICSCLGYFILSLVSSILHSLKYPVENRTVIAVTRVKRIEIMIFR